MRLGHVAREILDWAELEWRVVRPMALAKPVAHNVMIMDRQWHQAHNVMIMDQQWHQANEG